VFFCAAGTCAGQSEDGRFVSADGLISVMPPAGDGWECLQSRQKQDDSTVTMVKCRRSEASDFFFLTAKDYEYEQPQSASAESLSTEAFKNAYRRVYTSISYLDSKEVLHDGRQAWDVKFDATHDRLGTIRKVERVIVGPRHVLVLSGEGERVVFEQMQAVIEAWFATAVFASLPSQTSKPP
jgi:hypothetical protein